MRGVQIRDMHERGFLAVDLQHILDLFPERAIQSRWRASDVWATGQKGDDAAQKLEMLGDGTTFIAGDHFSWVAHRLVQVIDGEFSAFDRVSNSPWIVIRAVDASCYEVFSTEPAVLDRVRATFKEVFDCNYVA